MSQVSEINEISDPISVRKSYMHSVNSLSVSILCIVSSNDHDNCVDYSIVPSTCICKCPCPIFDGLRPTIVGP